MEQAFRLTEVAEQDLSEAARYIAEDSRDAAERFLAAFEETCDRQDVARGSPAG